MMGCNYEVDTNCIDDESPYHEVNVPEFAIDVTEASVGQYRACVDNGHCSEPLQNSNWCNWRYSEREDYPVTCINWHQAKAYCEWSGRRLCSESEWEKAARGTDGRIYPWGNEEADCSCAVMADDGLGCGEINSWPVGSKSPGVYGLYDMSGNVWEWIEDDGHSHYNNAPADGSVWISSPRSSLRGLRGGSFSNNFVILRASNRYFFDPDDTGGSIGVRCCR